MENHIVNDREAIVEEGARTYFGLLTCVPVEAREGVIGYQNEYL